jgi:hypothetical protein
MEIHCFIPCFSSRAGDLSLTTGLVGFSLEDVFSLFRFGVLYRYGAARNVIQVTLPMALDFVLHPVDSSDSCFRGRGVALRVTFISA